jgi:hypothetical protein
MFAGLPFSPPNCKCSRQQLRSDTVDVDTISPQTEPTLRMAHAALACEHATEPLRLGRWGTLKWNLRLRFR